MIPAAVFERVKEVEEANGVTIEISVKSDMTGKVHFHNAKTIYHPIDFHDLNTLYASIEVVNDVVH